MKMDNWKHKYINGSKSDWNIYRGSHQKEPSSQFMLSTDRKIQSRKTKNKMSRLTDFEEGMSY
jgi:hypothetical protein